MSAMDTDPREVKLPAWARKKLDDLRRELEDAQRHASEALLEVQEANEGSDTFIQRWDAPGVPLGREETISFIYGDDPKLNKIDVQVRRPSNVEPYVEVRTSYGALSIRPQVSNVVKVTVDPR